MTNNMNAMLYILMALLIIGCIALIYSINIERKWLKEFKNEEPECKKCEQCKRGKS